MSNFLKQIDDRIRRGMTLFGHLKCIGAVSILPNSDSTVTGHYCNRTARLNAIWPEHCYRNRNKVAHSVETLQLVFISL
jgi:hypothetical protein